MWEAISIFQEVENFISSKSNEPANEEYVFHEFLSINENINDDTVSANIECNGFFEIDLVVEGSGIHCISDKKIPCKENDIYVVSPNIPHKYFLDGTSQTLLIRRITFNLKKWFGGDAVAIGNKHYCYGVFDDGDSVAYAMLDSKTRDKIGTIFDLLECELTDKENEWRSSVRSYLMQLLIFIGRYVNYSVKNVYKKTNNDDVISKTVKIIHEEFGSCDLSLDSISKRVCVSSSHLSRNFKAATGKLFSEYLREVRFNHSAKLLEESDIPVDKIITQCGFKDVSSFYYKFREMFDMTPQNYRRFLKISAERADTNKTKEEQKTQIFKDISENVQKGKSKIVKELVQQAIDKGANVEEILNKGLLDGMGIIGEQFKNNEVYLPQVLVSARSMSMGTEVLKPLLVANGVKATGKVCIGTVQGDLHDIGKNLVKMMMEGKGLEVVDLGTDVAPEAFVKTAIEQNCRVICCSALLTTTMPVMEDVVKATEAAGIRDKVKIMIGGAPVNEEFCKRIGADCYTVDATSAADAAVEFCRE